MKIGDVISLAIRTLRGNKLRSLITIAIIALGITALVGIITAIQAMNQKLTESFSTMGASGFSIRFKDRNFRIGNNQRKLAVTRKGARQQKGSNLAQPITLEQAEAFKQAFTYPATVSLSCAAGNDNEVSAAGKKTNPVITLFGTDEAYVDLNGFALAAGRNFSGIELAAGASVCILGYDVAKKLFATPAAAVDGEVRINNGTYHVLAILKSRGSTFGFSRDNVALIPYKNADRNYRSNSFVIGVKSGGITRVEEAMGEAEGTLRGIRKLAVTEESNFALERSDNIASKAMSSLRYITAAVTIIGLITLVGAAIGLMNIMLVAVAERTKEIGLIKAIGGRSAAIRLQFLAEAILISIAGAIAGIIFGIALGNLFALVLSTAFVVPWNWVIYGIVICTIVGLVAGLYPALKAARLNPIQALRYE